MHNLWQDILMGLMIVGFVAYGIFSLHSFKSFALAAIDALVGPVVDLDRPDIDSTEAIGSEYSNTQAGFIVDDE
jgi:hypothetical protein